MILCNNVCFSNFKFPLRIFLRSRRKMSTLVSVHRVVSGAINAVKAAEHLITDILKGGTFRTIDKANSGGVLEDPQTIADVNAQKIIVGSMRKAFPGLNIIGEEGKLKCMDDHTIDVDLNFFPQADETYMVDIKDLILWVDPLDGTKEYISGHPEYVTVLVGLSYMGQAIAGVVGQPFSPVSSGNPVWGIVGKGFGGFAPQSSVSNHSVLTSRSHPTIEAQARVDDWLSRGLVSEQVRMGGAGAKV